MPQLLGGTGADLLCATWPTIVEQSLYAGQPKMSGEQTSNFARDSGAKNLIVFDRKVNAVAAVG